jgi:hypothetical protein
MGGIEAVRSVHRASTPPFGDSLLRIGLLFTVFVSALGPIGSPHQYTWPGDQMQRARVIGYALLSYAENHNGKFPEGNSSTEAFQKLLDFGYVRLIDGAYVHDPSIFYVPMAGKIEPSAGQKLKPENVCWDITCCLDSNASDSLPLVFLTGYKITYAPGGTAVPILKPYPPFTRTPGHWWHGAADPAENPGIAVFYKGGQAAFRHLYYTESTDGPDVKNPDNTIPNFIPPQFDPNGINYRQLTPDGPLP